MELKHIRYFLSVARHKSFSKAAAELMIAQPAVSRQIQLLEEELGVKVLFRTTRGVELTPAGAVLYRKGAEILDSVEHLARSLRSQGSRLQGKVSIGIPPSCTELFAPLIMSCCQSELPDVELRIIEGMSVFLEDWLSTGKIDLAILSGIPSNASTLYSAFAEEELVVFGAERLIGRNPREIEREELCDLNLIMAKAFRLSVAEQLGIDEQLLRCAMEIDSVPAIKKIVLSGHYATILPRSLITDIDRESGIMMRSIASRPRRNLFVSAHPRLATSSAIKAVRGVLLGPVRKALVGANQDGRDALFDLQANSSHSDRVEQLLA